MHFTGTVEITKFLRDRSKDISTRSNVALQLLEGNSNVNMPRKETVILEWIFDMLSTDQSAKKSAELWTLLAKTWQLTPSVGRLRILKNHKLMVNVCEALQTQDSSLIDVIVNCVLLVSESVQLFAYVTDAQATQIVLTYLGYCPQNTNMGEFVFESVKSRSRLFASSDSTSLDLIIKEPSLERRSHYLTRYLSSPANPIISQSKQFAEHDIERLVAALCNTGVSVKSRVLSLCTELPHCIRIVLNVLHAKKSTCIDSELVNQLMAIVFSGESLDWLAINECLHVSPAPIIENQEYMQTIMTKGPILDDTMVLILEKSAQLRTLVEVLPKWNPLNRNSPVVRDTLTKAIGTLSPVQVSNLIENITSNFLLLENVVKALTYPMASTPVVSKVLEALMLSEEVPTVVKSAILEVLPILPLKKAKKLKDANLVLRAAELNPKNQEYVRKLVKKADDVDYILLRFYPLIEESFSLEDKVLVKLVKKVSKETRLKLVKAPRALECSKVTKQVINTVIENEEIPALSVLPKQVFEWTQRHEAVAIALKQEDFDVSAAIVIKLFDHQKFPSADSLSGFLSRASPSRVNIDQLLQLLQVIKKNHEFTEEVIKGLKHEWLIALFRCELSKKDDKLLETTGDKTVINWLTREYQNDGLIEPVLTVLSYLPPSEIVKKTTRDLSLTYIKSDKKLPPKLFEIVCRQGYHWSVVTAFYLCAWNESDVEEFTNYCKSLTTDDLKLLLFTSVDSSQYRVLTTLTKNRLLSAENYAASYTEALTVAVVKSSNEPSSNYWRFCQSAIRECPNQLSQFAVDTLLEVITTNGSSTTDQWHEMASVVSDLLNFKRRALRHRVHLIVATLTSLLQGIQNIEMAYTFRKLVNSFCNPPQLKSKARLENQELTSHVAKQRRAISKHAGVLLQNLILIILQSNGIKNSWFDISNELRLAAFDLVDLIYGNGLKAVSAGMDNANRAYLRSIFDDYKLHSRWSGD